MLDRELFETIMEDDDLADLGRCEGCNALAGLNLIARYMPKAGIEGADHDIIYSVDVDELLGSGLTEQDARKLRELNWMIYDDNYLACFV